MPVQLSLEEMNFYWWMKFFNSCHGSIAKCSYDSTTFSIDLYNIRIRTRMYGLLKTRKKDKENKLTKAMAINWGLNNLIKF